MGFDIKPNRSHIYWPMKWTISVEHDCYFNNITRSSESLKGGEEGIVCRNIVSYASYGTMFYYLMWTFYITCNIKSHALLHFCLIFFQEAEM